MPPKPIALLIRSRFARVVVFAAGGVIGLFVLAALIVPLMLNADAYKRRFEATSSGPTGLDFHVGGRLGIDCWRGLRITVSDLHVRNRLGADVITAERASFGIEILPLARGEVRIRSITLIRPRVFIERDREGVLNFERRAKPRGALPSLDRARVALIDGGLLYADLTSGNRLGATNIRLDVRRLQVPVERSAGWLNRVSFRATGSCDAIRAGSLLVSDLRVSADGREGKFNFSSFTMEIFGGKGSGSLEADVSGPVPRCRINYSLSRFGIGEFLKVLSPVETATGSMSFSAHLSMHGSTAKEWVKTAGGAISLRGAELKLAGHDLDRELGRFESSQSFNLVDVGAVFLAGPLGLAVTRGYNFASLFRGSGGSTELRTVVSDWNMANGILKATDVAMATSENRLALTGGFDFAEQRFDGVTVALVDEKGCVKVKQEIRGPFAKPDLGKPSVLGTLTGPAVRMLKRTKDLLPGGPCEVFYAGSVAPPQ